MVLSLYEALLAVCCALLPGLEVLVAPCGPALHRSPALFVRSPSESFRAACCVAVLVGPGRSGLKGGCAPPPWCVCRQVRGMDDLLTVPRSPCGGWYVSAIYRTAGLRRASEPPFEAPSHAKEPQGGQILAALRA